MTGRAALPNWVVKRDGRLAPFDGDTICRGLFAAGERLGRSDPFLARELTDGVLHFLTSDGAGDPLPTAEIAEVVIKVVRELGHPALALAYEQYRSAKSRRPATDAAKDHSSPRAESAVDALIAGRPSARVLTRHVAAAALAAFSRRAVYPRDLVAAERDGLLYFFDSDTPLELAGAVTQTSLPVARSANLGGVEALETARERVGQYVALDGPEYFLAPVGSLSAAGAWVRELRIGLRFTGLRAVVNLNCASPPPATVGTAGPLFASLAPGDELRYSDFCDALLDHLLDGDPEGVRVDWHLGDRDFEPVARNRLIRLARRVLDGAPLAFVPDRARRSIALAEGLDRHHAAVLCAVGVSLPRLAEIVRPVDPSVYLTKLGSLARLALSAGQARRDFLRRHARPDVSRGFEIDRARLVVTPVGLAEAVHKVIGQPLTAIGPGLEFARQVWQTLHAVLGGGTAPGFAVSLDSLPPLALHNSLPTTDSGAAEGTVRQQLRAAAVLHAEVEAGTAVVRLPTDHRPTPEDVAHLLWYAWQQPGLTRVSVVREVPAPRQLTAGWDAQGPQ